MAPSRHAGVIGALAAAALLCGIAALASTSANGKTTVLGSAHTVARQVQTFTGYCPPPKSGPAPPCAPPGLRSVANVRLTSRESGLMRIRGNATASNLGPAGDACSIGLTARVDHGRLPHTSHSGAWSGVPETSPYRGLSRVTQGSHLIELDMSVGYCVGPVQVTPVKLRAVVKPLSKRRAASNYARGSIERPISPSG
jgi:hypothetical protein